MHSSFKGHFETVRFASSRRRPPNVELGSKKKVKMPSFRIFPWNERQEQGNKKEEAKLYETDGQPGIQIELGATLGHAGRFATAPSAVRINSKNTEPTSRSTLEENLTFHIYRARSNVGKQATRKKDAPSLGSLALNFRPIARQEPTSTFSVLSFSDGQREVKEEKKTPCVRTTNWRGTTSVEYPSLFLFLRLFYDAYFGDCRYPDLPREINMIRFKTIDWSYHVSP